MPDFNMGLFRPVRQSHSLATLTLIFWLANGSLLAAEKPEDWLRLETPRFTMISEINEASTRQWAVEFNQFIDSLALLIRVDEAELPPLTIYLFRRERDFQNYVFRRPDGSASTNIDGFFTAYGSQSMIALPFSNDRDTNRDTIFHEAVHWYASALPYRLPPWLSEGLAEVLASATFRKDDIVWGQIQEGRLAHLMADGLMSTATLVKASSQHELFNHDDKTGVFYASAWLMVHYQLFGTQQVNSEGLRRYMAHKGKQVSRAEFTEAFGQTYEEMDAALARYMRGGKFRTVRIPVNKPQADWPLSALTAEDLYVNLMTLAMTTDRWESAQSTFDLLHEATGDSNRVQALQARLMMGQQGQRVAGIALARELLANGYDDPDLLFVLADTLFQQGSLRSAPDQRFPPARAREIADYLHAAITIRPQLERAYLMLARTLPSVNSTTADDEERLLYAAAHYLDTEDYLLGLANLAWIRKDSNRAFAILAQTRRDYGGGDYDQDIDYHYVKWRTETVMDAINSLAPRDPQAALAEAQSLVDDPLLPERVKSSFRSNVLSRLQEAVQESATP